MILINDRFFRLDKPNSTFIIFNDYGLEDEFDSFLEFIHKNLGGEVGEIIQLPYSKEAPVSFFIDETVAVFHEDIGCAIRINSDKESLIQDIIVKLQKY